jgi:hypothetical protein
MEIRIVGAEFFYSDGQTQMDGETNDEVNSRFSQLRERAKQPINFFLTHTPTNMYLTFKNLASYI